jgi:DNA-binding NtrC family response regulator
MRNKETATVLVVDDDPVLLGIVAEQISLYGYQPILATSGEEALQVAPKQTTKIDLLLTDIMMPRMNGVDLAKQFISMYPEAKVLFMSGYICPSMAHYGVSDSEHAFLQKPFTQKTLISKMRNVLEGPDFDLTENDPDS